MQRPRGTGRFVTLIALTLIVGGALAAGQSIIFDPDTDPVADFPGNVNISSGNLDIWNGDLDMRQNQLGGVSTLGVNGTIELDNTDSDIIRLTQAIGDKQHTIRFDGNNLRFWSGDGAGTVLRLFNESGDVGLGGNTLTNVGGTDCAADEALLGDGSCRSTGVSDDWVNETGDTMTGNLDMSGNEVQTVGRVTNQQSREIYDKTPTHGGLASGWYTIANQTGNRASAKFFVMDTNGGEHTAVQFYATHMYGTDDSNTINVVSDADYNNGCVERIRIREGGTYEGANLQIYLDTDSCSGVQAFMKDNFQNSGWELLDWYAGDATSGFSTAASVNLDTGPNNAMRTTSGLKVKGQIDNSAANSGLLLPTGDLH